MKILLTGPQGNLGSSIVRSCRHQIVNVGRNDWQHLDELLAAGIDVVIHTAYDLKNRVTEVPVHLFESNLMSTTRLIEAMHRHHTPRLIFISTCAVYGESMKTSEETQCCPISINGIVKLLNEKTIEAYCRGNGIKYEIYRVFNSFGGDDKFSILSHLQESITKGHPFQLNNNGISQRDFIHIDDVAKIILALLDIEHSYTHMNIGTGVSTRISEIVAIFMRKYPELSVIANSIYEAEYSRADISKLRTLLDFDFIDVKEYVENTF